MKFTIRYENIDKPLTLNEFIEKKIIKLEKMHNLGENLKINVSLNKEQQYEVSINLEVPHEHETLVAFQSDQDIYVAIDKCIDKLMNQAIKLKEKRSSH